MIDFLNRVNIKTERKKYHYPTVASKRCIAALRNALNYGPMTTKKFQVATGYSEGPISLAIRYLIAEGSVTRKTGTGRAFIFTLRG